MSVVYFARDDRQLIKIGFTTDLVRRTKELSHLYCRPMSPIAFVPGTMATESAMLSWFHQYRDHGKGREWFRDEMLDTYAWQLVTELPGFHAYRQLA